MWRLRGRGGAHVGRSLGGLLCRGLLGARSCLCRGCRSCDFDCVKTWDVFAVMHQERDGSSAHGNRVVSNQNDVEVLVLPSVQPVCFTSIFCDCNASDIEALKALKK